MCPGTSCAASHGPVVATARMASDRVERVESPGRVQDHDGREEEGTFEGSAAAHGGEDRENDRRREDLGGQAGNRGPEGEGDQRGNQQGQLDHGARVRDLGDDDDEDRSDQVERQLVAAGRRLPLTNIGDEPRPHVHPGEVTAPVAPAPPPTGGETTSDQARRPGRHSMRVRLGRTMQNSLPSGSASTIHDSSPV